jgi:hypothetical protein
LRSVLAISGSDSDAVDWHVAPPVLWLPYASANVAHWTQE